MLRITQTTLFLWYGHLKRLPLAVDAELYSLLLRLPAEHDQNDLGRLDQHFYCIEFLWLNQ